MKKTKFFAVMLACVLAFSLVACAEKTPQTTDPQTYTIQYADETGIHSISVQSGSLYSISPIPEKHGYEFLGLFDAETGGTQYVNSGGSSLAAFSDNKNIVLYPQFKAKEYTLILDYQGAEVTGSRSLNVSYNSEIRELPLNVTLPNKNFTGWYTAPDCKGNQIADSYGVRPENRKVTEKLYDLTDPDGNIKLYAGFRWVEYTVTFYAQDDGKPQEVKVSHGTVFDTIKPTVIVNNKMVISWSRKRNDVDKTQIFYGEITDNVILYAAEYAPFVEFDANGGNEVASLTVRTGDIVRLPLPTRAHYKFLGWQRQDGDLITSVVMPENSIRLVAQWQAMIEFDTNGGAAVASISEPQGTEIMLPETEKTGFIFAGWYTANGEKYENTVMPSESLALCAKYYQVKKITKVIINATNAFEIRSSHTSPSVDENCKTLDLSDLFAAGVKSVNISAHYRSWIKGYNNDQPTPSRPSYTCMTWYSAQVASDGYKVWEYRDKHVESHTSLTCHQSTRLALNTGKYYICFFNSNGIGSYTDWKDFYVEIEYTDMRQLY